MDPLQLPEALNLVEVFLGRQAAAHPGRTALLTPDGAVTYGQLQDWVDRATGLYRSLGLEPEQRVLLMVHDRLEFAVAWLGAVKAGGVVSAVNPQVSAEEVASYLRYTRAKVLVVEAQALPAVQAARAAAPSLRHVLVVAGQSADGPDFLASCQAATPDPGYFPSHRDDPAVWLYTSGSTGFPKAAVHKHRDFVFNALTYSRQVVGYRASEVCLSVPRLAFGYALGTNLLFPLLAGGAAILHPDKPTPELLLSLLARHRPTLLTAVPTALNQLLNAPGLAGADFSSLRVALSAGEALPAELYRKWKERTGVEVLDGIGSAEMFHIFISNRLDDVKVGSLGRVVEGYRAKVADDEGREVPRGEVGTLWISGDSMALEYWQAREKSKATFRGEWCVSADRFQQDEDGYFFFCGRGDDMLKVGGKWVSPVEVENALLGHPAVHECAVVGFTDADGLVKPRAFVVVKPGQAATPQLAEALQAHVRAALKPYQAPRQVRFVEALPRSDRGKVLKAELAKEP